MHFVFQPINGGSNGNINNSEPIFHLRSRTAAASTPNYEVCLSIWDGVRTASLISKFPLPELGLWGLRKHALPRGRTKEAYRTLLPAQGCHKMDHIYTDWHYHGAYSLHYRYHNRGAVGTEVHLPIQWYVEFTSLLMIPFEKFYSLSLDRFFDIRMKPSLNISVNKK